MKGRQFALSIVLLAAAASARAQAPAEPIESGTPEEASVAPTAGTQVAEPALEAPTPALSAPKAIPEMLSEAELVELGVESSESAVNTDIQLSGFIDFGGIMGFGNVAKTVLGKPAFSVGNVNLYLTKNLTSSVRTMLEVRFLYLPNGAAKSLMDPTPVVTTSADYADFNRPLKWGGVEIERVYVEWMAFPFLTLRVGQFLTPYGVWNVDHGSPTIIPMQRPFVVGYNFFPERQTGFELYGRTEISNYSTLGYHLTLSNGTGPATEYKDLDANKAIGARLYWEYRKLGELRIGASAYYGRDTDLTSTLVSEMGQLKANEKVTTQSDSLAFAVDATFKYQGIHAQFEFITRQLKFTDAGRTVAFSVASLGSHYPADGFRYGGYLLLGYRFEWLGTMPYVVLQRTGGIDTASQQRDFATPLVFGLNFRPIDALVLKIEYAHVMFDKGQVFPNEAIRVGGLQLAWAF